jgi:two-component system KDP operon response regulator KdpE
MPARILVVDDEPNIIASVRVLLAASGYEVSVAMCGHEALERVGRDRPDVVVLDLGLPDMNGVDVCRFVREDRGVPSIVLSARGSERDKVRALDAGADDYITKPFGSDELCARIRSALRRSSATNAPAGPLVRGDLIVDYALRRATIAERELKLTPKEFALLTFLARHAGRVLSHRNILRATWGPQAVDQPEYLRVLVASLRRKIEPDLARPRYILTEPWVGYRFADNENPDPRLDTVDHVVWRRRSGR